MNGYTTTTDLKFNSFGLKKSRKYKYSRTYTHTHILVFCFSLFLCFVNFFFVLPLPLCLTLMIKWRIKRVRSCTDQRSTISHGVGILHAETKNELDSFQLNGPYVQSVVSVKISSSFFCSFTSFVYLMSLI